METTLIGERLKEAFMAKNSPDLSSLIWRGEKKLDDNGRYIQSEKKLVDMDQSELSNCYNKCKAMLFNKDVRYPGRYVLLETIAEQRDRCGAELFIRYIEEEASITRFNLMNMISTFLVNNREILKNVKPILSHAFSKVPNEFEQVPLNLIIDGCLDRLGTFNKKPITRNFILKQGIWLTPSEAKDLVEYDSEGKLVDRITVIRERLNIKEVERLHINSKGLNYTEMRALLNLKHNKKYLDLTTTQLETLRNKALFTLEEDVRKHISDWESRMEQIEQVASFKGFKL